MKKKKQKKGNKLLILIWNLLFYIIMLSILIGSILMALTQQKDQSLNGYRIFGVLTNSMVSPDNTLKKGGFRAGDILITKEVKPEDVKVGDVITYRPSTNPTNKSTNFLTHRVVKIKDGLGNEKGLFFITQGDANKTEDMPISSAALIGREVTRIPKLGGVLSFVKENWIVSAVFIVSVLGFIWIIKNYILPSSSPTKSDGIRSTDNRGKIKANNKGKKKTNNTGKKFS